jgi:serine/threonine protein phosphatase PrpC
MAPRAGSRRGSKGSLRRLTPRQGPGIGSGPIRLCCEEFQAVKSRLFIDHVSEASFGVGNQAFEVEVLCCPSPEHPERNEDSVGSWLFPDGSLVLAVADGMGGTPAGSLASRLAIEQLDETFAAIDKTVSMRSLILDAFEAANQKVLKLAAGSGTTLVAVEIVGSTVRTYNVGDSGALLVGQRGRMKIETTDHSPVGYGVAAGLIDSEAAMTHEDRHFLSNYIGTNAMHIELGIPRQIDRFDTLLVASDGLFDNVSPAQTIETIRCGPLSERISTLGRGALAAMQSAVDGDSIGKPDDLTIVLARRRRV